MSWERADVQVFGVWRAGWARRDVFDAGGKYVPVKYGTGLVPVTCHRSAVVFR